MERSKEKWVPKVGDRVVVYATRMGNPVRRNGTVLTVEPDRLWLEMDSTLTTSKIFAHPKQCRPIVKKKRREFWLRFNELKQPEACSPEPLMKRHQTDEVIHVREVKRK